MKTLGTCECESGRTARPKRTAQEPTETQRNCREAVRRLTSTWLE